MIILLTLAELPASLYFTFTLQSSGWTFQPWLIPTTQKSCVNKVRAMACSVLLDVFQWAWKNKAT